MNSKSDLPILFQSHYPTTTKPVRILIVDTMDWGKPYPQNHPLTQKGTWYHHCFLQSLGFKVKIVHWAEKKRPWKEFPFDICILSGSIRSATKATSANKVISDWIEWCLNHHKKLMGICYGCQMIAHVLGGTITKAKEGPQVGNVALNFHVPAFESDAESESEPQLPPSLPDFFKINWLTSHLDEISELPSKAIHLASSQHCQYEAFAWGNQVLGFQFHPEMTPEILKFLWRPHLNSPTTRCMNPDLQSCLSSVVPPDKSWHFTHLVKSWAALD